jgi:Cof subfamily protein (haloacid dehalogenase superfamily)
MAEAPAPHLVVLDIDGTLLTSAGEILPSTRRAIGALIARGHHVVLASARPPRSVAALSRDLIGEGAAGLISLNGALVSRGAGILLERCILPPTAAAIVRAARARSLTISLYSGWHWKADELTAALREEASILGFEPLLVADLTGQTDPVHKLLALGDPAEIERFRDWLNASALGVNAALSKPCYAEITSATASKADAVAFLRAGLAVARGAVVAIGDGENDIPMLQDAGIGIAMGNAAASVQQAADRITASNDRDGVAEALRALRLIS